MITLIKRLAVSAIRISILLVFALGAIWLITARPLLSNNGVDEEGAMVESSALKIHVDKLSLEFVPRDYRHPDNLDAVAQYILSHFNQSGAKVYEQPYSLGGIVYKNILAEYGPESDEIIIVGAHYDAAFEFPGADDNASGIAGLLELSRLLSQDSLKTKIMLAAYTLEEPPFFSTEYMGSMVHARHLKENNVKVKLMICFEMIGYFTDEPESQKFPIIFMKYYYPTTGNFIGIVDQVFSRQAVKLKKWMKHNTGLPVYSINAPTVVPGVNWSDHYSFWKFGYPAVMITDTAFYRNTAYHTANDTPDRLDFEKMAEVVSGVYTYVKYLSNK